MTTKRRRKKSEPIQIDGPEFRCHFMEMYQYPSLNMSDPDEDRGTRPVRFHGSNFWNVRGFGSSRWVLCGYIVVDWEALAKEGYTNEEIFKGCAKFLNKPPERKRFQKRIKRPLFGNIDPTPIKVRPRIKNGTPVLEVLVVTDKRKLKSAWGEGQTVPIKARKRLM